jgi:hypothetical protein
VFSRNTNTPAVSNVRGFTLNIALAYAGPSSVSLI